MYELLALIPSTIKTGRMAQASNPNSQEITGRRSKVQGHPWLQREAKLGHMRPCLKISFFFAVGFGDLKFIKWPEECLGIRTEFSMICGMAQKILLSFYTIYLCNVTFSALIIIGTKYP